jgi:hypothetical protein
MKNNKKKILAIILVVLVLILGGASIYVATQLSTKQTVAPNAPTSKPAATEPCATGLSCSDSYLPGTSECMSGTTTTYCCPSGQTITNGACAGATITWVGSDACTVTGTAVATLTTSMSLEKRTYSDNSANSAGNYTLSTIISSIDSGSTFVYYLYGVNTGTATTSATITDVLTGNNLDQLTYVDSDSGCSYNSSSRTVSCTIANVAPTKAFGRAVRVTVASDTANGTVIANTATLTYGSNTVQATKSITVNNAAQATLTGSKTAYKNVSGNTAGSYTLSTEMTTVSKSQEYVYLITLKNTSDVTATGVTVKDSLKDISNLTFVDTVDGCTWSSTDKVLTCNTTIASGATKMFAFRVTAASGIANGDVISNTAKVTYNGDSLSLTKDLTVSSVVGCNNTCTTDDECSTGLTCDSTTSKCRLAACLTETDCTCATTVKTVYVTATATPTKVATKSATPTTLPETGVLDIPGVAAFGGGLFLAVVGILLAL